MKKLFLSLFFLSSLNLSAQKLNVDLEHYQKLAQLSKQSQAELATADTLRFPWKEYGESGIRNSFIKTFYMTESNLTTLKNSFLPPANSSKQTQAELKYLLELQEKRTQEDINRSMYLANIGYFPYYLNPENENYKRNLKDLFFFGYETFGEWMNAENFPKTSELLKGIMQDMRAVEFNLKLHFRRPRPYHLEPQLKNLQRMQSPAFPSGHTLFAFTNALIFSELAPSSKANFVALANELRFSREILGIHYPSDNEQARLIAEQMFKFWKANPQFQKDLLAAKIEWSKESVKFLKK
ncbi:MAG: phosphatase PAP2 family protein [Spirosomataceae bacterium]